MFSELKILKFHCFRNIRHDRFYNWINPNFFNVKLQVTGVFSIQNNLLSKTAPIFNTLPAINLTAGIRKGCVFIFLF